MEIKIPRSFSQHNKPFDSPNDLFSFVEILNKFEFDTYIDVVILGFQVDLELLDTQLNNLANLPSFDRKLGYTREKLVFRISSLAVPEILGEKDETHPEELMVFLNQHHLKFSSKFTIYVLNLANNNLRSSLAPIYISGDGFAYINLWKIENIVGTVLTKNTLGVEETAKLASSIFQSTELLIPVIESVSESSRFIRVRLFIICGFPLKNCTPDPRLTSVFEFISQSFGDHPLITFQYSVSVLSVTDSISMMTSLVASSGEFWSWKNNLNAHSSRAKVSAFSFSSMLDLLLQSHEIRNILVRDSQDIPKHGTLLPVISLLLPDELDAFFHFPPSFAVKNWSQYPIMLASTINGVIFLRPQLKIEYSRGGLKHEIQYVDSFLNSGFEIEENHELSRKLLEVIWHPSTSIRNTQWTGIKSPSFIIDMRTIYRQLIFASAERLLSRVSSLLIHQQSQSEIYAIRSKISPPPWEDLQHFVHRFDVIATDFSHLDYQSALIELDLLEVRVSEMEEVNLTSTFHSQLYLHCQTSETDSKLSIPAVTYHSVVRMTSTFTGLLLGFLLVAIIYQLTTESKKNLRRVIR